MIKSKMANVPQKVLIPPSNKMQLINFPLKIFVKGHTEPHQNIKFPKLEHATTKEKLSGNDAKNYYESVVNDKTSGIESVLADCTKPGLPSNIVCSRIPTTKTNSKPPKTERIYSKKEILLAVEQNNINILKYCLNNSEMRKALIGSKDGYGWTTLMIAACAGSFETVKLLLINGADIHEKDRSGNTCLSLAKRRRHNHIVNYIKSHMSESSGQSSKERRTCSAEIEQSDENKICDVCCLTFRSDRLFRNHHTSTVHLLNQQRKELEASGGNPKVHYVIPQANRGFQMMLSKGWDANVGLGPSGKGKLYPVKTVLKRDRHGLGLESNGDKRGVQNSKKAKVTHFGPGDTLSVENISSLRTEKPSTMTKKQRASKQNRSTIKEIDFRREFM